VVTADTSVDKARWPESAGDNDGANPGLSEVDSRPVRPRRKLTPEQKYQVFLETQRGDTPVAGSCEVGHPFVGPDGSEPGAAGAGGD
jgi:hypothetical protein